MTGPPYGGIESGFGEGQLKSKILPSLRGKTRKKTHVKAENALGDRGLVTKTDGKNPGKGQS